MSLVQARSIHRSVTNILNIITPDSTVAATPDSSVAINDTLIAKKPGSDSARTESSDIDTSIYYNAKDSVIYSIRTRYMNLYGKSDLKYKNMGLKSELIDVNWDIGTLTAVGVKDTTDTTGVKLRDTPVMNEGAEVYNGEKVMYNFRSQKGKIIVGTTAMDNGFYRGDAIKKIADKTLFVHNGRFTSCDSEHPHFYFASPKMKVYVQDHIVAEPIIFYVADVPVFMLPFGAFPNESGRRSGIIGPAFGNDAQHGRYLTHWGYYWAMNDYMDFATTFDWYARGGIRNNSNFRYNKRYEYSGTIVTSYGAIRTGDFGDPGLSESRDYRAYISHQQTFNPTTNASVNFTFASSDYFRRFSNNINDALQQNIYSNATLTKTFEDLNGTLTLNISRDQNLKTGDVREVLPSLSYYQGMLYPFKRSTRSRGLSVTSGEQPWYELVGIGYSNNFQLNRNLTFTPIKSTVNTSLDSTTRENLYERMGANHNLSISASPKLGYISITPSISYSERWYTKSIRTDSTGTVDVNGFNAVRTFSLGISASTRFFGMFQPQLFGIKGIRHTVTPAVSFSYAPDFSKPMWGYFGAYTDKNHVEQKYSYYASEVFGGPGIGESQSISLGIGNNLEMKYTTSDTAQRDQKIQLLNFNASVSYNIAATSFKLTPLSINYYTNIGSLLNLSGSTTFNPYVYVKTGAGTGSRIDRYSWMDKKFPDLTSFSFNMSTSLQGTKKQTQQPVRPGTQQVQPGTTPPPGSQQSQYYRGIFPQEEPDFSIPWNLSLNYMFQQSQETPGLIYRYSSMSGHLSFNLTEKWQIDFNGSYDLANKELLSPSVNVNRDLHCWLLTFSWTPLGLMRGYRLELRVKAPQLQDLKLTKEGNARGYY
jgi:lipopolysaccharide assembly outer membrane protein LptD (OstA)